METESKFHEVTRGREIDEFACYANKWTALNFRKLEKCQRETNFSAGEMEFARNLYLRDVFIRRIIAPPHLLDKRQSTR